VKVRWLDEAVTDLKGLRRHIIHDNPSAAAEVAQPIREAVRILGDYAAAGRPGRVPYTGEFIISGAPYVVPYRVRAGAIEILRVLHAAQKWPDR
jgi:plasmid stabilization system protein ParE